MRKILINCCMLVGLGVSTSSLADTIDNYMNIVTNLPQMEMKADSESQAWARSARNILMLTSETIAESLILANMESTKQGFPLFCLPLEKKLSNGEINEIIKNSYNSISSTQGNDRNKMTVSQIALLGIQKNYPCKKKT